ncbi:MAG TPA: ATP-binding protein [Candidatus Acidoferrales bacterium]|jgi:serine/threonine-protein kinase RsbW|nr:ATP-binding protein [Candidatus Acidoferrales bacterium]
MGPAIILMATGEHITGERLDLQSRMSDLARVPPWIERLASLYAIPDSTQFSINLCLEEVLSNIIRHGYSSEPGRSISVQFTCLGKDNFVFVVEDEAPPFDPVHSPALPAVGEFTLDQIGGQGIRLLREFADALEYQPTPSGNRLSIGFSSVSSAARN